MRIGIAGFGRMGAAMGARIVEQSHQLTVWNRSPGPAATAAALGARVVSTPAALANDCDVILSSLFDEAAVRTVYLGRDGLAHARLDGRLVIDTSTVGPEMGPELARAVASAGGRFIDAPVLGTVMPAREGKLIVLAGGVHADMLEAKATLDMISRAVHLLGPSGAGYAGKLAINVMKATYWATLGDCLGLARRFHIEPSAILDVIESGPGRSFEFPGKLPVLRGEITAPAFDIAGCLKDLKLIVAAGGGSAGVPVAAGALQVVTRAVDGGWGQHDVAAVALFAADQVACRDEASRESRRNSASS